MGIEWASQHHRYQKLSEVGWQIPLLVLFHLEFGYTSILVSSNDNMTSMILYTLFDSNVSNLMLCSSIVLGISTIIRTFHRWNHKPFSNLCLPFLLLSWCFHYMPTSNLIRPYKTIKILGYNGIYHDVHIYIYTYNI